LMTRESLERALRVAREEVTAMRTRATAREREFREEIRALAARCASLAAERTVAELANTRIEIANTTTNTNTETNDERESWTRREAVAGDLSSLFFKTARYERPTWERASERAVKRETPRVRDEDVVWSDDASLEASMRGKEGARRDDGFDWNARDAAFEDDGEADLADSLRDDDGLVDALVRGGVEGERAAEILAERLRAVAFAAEPRGDADARRPRGGADAFSTAST